ncbi:hypothetical protein SAMN05216522_101199 [Rosenbergiella nectarea]|uniref:Uncharacterized protein n=1 Tax=Rosenbergiella nectarea TaxID=988801 RepID=A0A1H9D9P2_9GAMM|nr:hypothetical protein SAMN05216522_101199 [Rosenbergiella nectarea]
MARLNPPVKSTSPVRVNLPVFLCSSLLILLMGLVTILYPTASQLWLARAQTSVTAVRSNVLAL